MSDLLKEFEDDMRREQAESRWRSFGKNMVAISVAIIIGTIGAVVWQNVKEKRAVKETSALLAGLDRIDVEDYKGAVTSFEDVAKNSSSNKYGIAMLRKAHAQRLQGDTAGAIKTYNELARHNDKDNAGFAGIARLLAAELSGEMIEPDKASPYYHAQLEWKAWQLVDKGETDEAVKLFVDLQDDTNTPIAIHGRSAEALQLLRPETLLESAAADKASGHE